MKTSRKLAIFTDKYPLIGPIIWVLAAEYFVAQLVVASSFISGYSWANNVISDLGNSACGHYSNRFVCSPDHALMNASFILLGIIMASGSLLIYQEFRESRKSLVGFSLMVLAGIGSIFVGIFPENTVGVLHSTGAILALGIGNVSLIVLGLALGRVRNIFRYYTLATGIVSLVAFLLFASGFYLGLGEGAIERIASYPQTLWLILFGLYMTASHYQNRQVSTVPKN